MLDWSMMDLAGAARLSVSTIKRMETSGAPAVSEGALASARTVLEAAGIRFVSDGASDGLWLVRG